MNQLPEPTNDAELRRVIGRYATGVTVVTTKGHGQCWGFTCQTLSSVSLSPPLVAFFVRAESYSWKKMRESRVLGISILTESQVSIARVFATPGIDKFSGIEFDVSPQGAPLIAGALGWLECETENIVPAGDHEGVIGHITAMGAVGDKRDESPLIYWRSNYEGLRS